MSLGDCVNSSEADLPDPIVDLSTLSINYDNMGVATLSIVLWTSTTDNITGSCSINLGGGTFKGHIVSDSPQEVEGTEYYSHSITAEGMVNGGSSGGGSAPAA
jgi:hypothetical protein